MALTGIRYECVDWIKLVITVFDQQMRKSVELFLCGIHKIKTVDK